MNSTEARTPGENAGAAGQVFSLGDLPAMLWRRKGLLTFLMLLCIGLGCAYLPFATPVYLVQARVFVVNKGPSLDPNQRLDLEDKDYLATQAQILHSPMIVKESMLATPGPFPGEIPTVGIKSFIKSAAPILFPTVGDDPKADALDTLYKNLSVDPVLGTNVILVRYKTPTIDQGLGLVNEMVTRYRDFTREQTLRELGKIGDTPRIEEELWRAKVREKELGETLGDKHPELRAVQEQIPVWENLLRIRREADRVVAEAQADERVSLIEGPAVAPDLDWPRPILLLAVCAMLGLTGGITMVWFLDAVDPKLFSTKDVRTHLGLPVLARIPIISVPWRAGPAPLYRGRLVNVQPGSPGAETFRALRANLQRRLNGDAGHAVAIVSSRESEGKTTVTADLALSFAQLGKRVIVVDADLRRGRIDWIFNVPGKKGLTSILHSGTPLDEAIERSPVAAVDVLSRGPLADNPGELLAQDAFSKVVHLLKQQYDIVLIDTAPLLCTADGWVLTSDMDGVVLTIASGRTLVSEARRSREQLDYLGAKLLGVVINQASDVGTYNQYSPYGYYYSSRPAVKQSGANGKAPAAKEATTVQRV